MSSEIWSYQRLSGIAMSVAVFPLMLGVFLFLRRSGIRSAEPPGELVYLWERGSILAAAVLTALGLVLLETRFQDTSGGALARLGAWAFFFGAVLLVVGEAKTFPLGPPNYPLIVFYVVLAFLGQAAIGAAILRAGLLTPWIGWMTIIWNLGWLVILPITTPSDIYFPVLHHLMPLVIGIALLF